MHAGYYRRLAVAVTIEDGARPTAFAYHGTMTVPGRKPSARYVGLLLDGAREHALPAEWIRHLETLELAVDERLGTQGRRSSGAGSGA